MKTLVTTILLFILTNVYAQNRLIDTLYFGGDKYIGEIENGKPNGKGKYYYAGGSLYEGNLKNGEYAGKGSIQWKNGNTYTGDWKDSKMDGFGTKKWGDGTVYTGDWKNDLCDGKGTIKYANGSSYDGDWKEDKMHGYGLRVYSDGAKYEGNWENDFREGEGKGSLASGYYRQGTFKNDDAEKVKYYNKNSTEVTFEEYRGNPKSGFDSVYYGKDKYVGYFDNYQMNGKGKYYEENGSVYEGDFVNGKYSGKGNKKWASGDKYEGDWVNDKREGTGSYTWADGETYVGNYKNNTKNGEGKLKKSNGYYYTAKFKNGDPKKATYYSDKGEEITFYLWNIEVKKLNFHNAPSSIQSSYADMSEFTNVKGCMIILHNNFMNIFVVKGKTMISQSVIAAKCAAIAGFKGGDNYQYEWATEKTCQAVMDKYRFKRSAECNGDFNLDN